MIAFSEDCTAQYKRLALYKVDLSCSGSVCVFVKTFLLIGCSKFMYSHILHCTVSVGGGPCLVAERLERRTE